jgi:hypothetical protein
MSDITPMTATECLYGLATTVDLLAGWLGDCSESHAARVIAET